MGTITSFLFKAERSLTKYDDAINTDCFEATVRFNEAYSNAHLELVEYLNLPALHLWDGFCQGDASDEEIAEVIRQINLSGSAELEDEDDLYTFLDDELMLRMEGSTARILKEYEEEYKEEYERALEMK